MDGFRNSYLRWFSRNDEISQHPNRDVLTHPMLPRYSICRVLVGTHPSKFDFDQKAILCPLLIFCEYAIVIEQLDTMMEPDLARKDPVTWGLTRIFCMRGG